MVVSRWIAPLLRTRLVRRALLARVRRGPAGPGEAQRARGASLLWGEVVAPDGRRAASWIRAASGYTLTAQTAVHLAMKALEGNAPTGFRTPSLAYGADVIMEIPGVTRRDSPAASAPG